MRASTAVKKDISTSKLSPNSAAPVPHLDFDPQRLVQELLSLGHQKITPRLALSLSQEVGAELKRRPAPQVSAELISDLVRFKLQELGILRKPEEEETAALFPETEAKTSENFPDREPLGFRAKRTRLPTLEKWIKPAMAPAPLPPRGELKLSARSLRRLQGHFPGLDPVQLRGEIESRLQTIARQAAQAELRFSQGQATEIREVEFFNSMCNLEFLPQHPRLMGPNEGAKHQAGVWLQLPQGKNSVESVLNEAKHFWKLGGKVGFRLDSIADEAPFDAKSFENFLVAIETALVGLSGEGSLPTVGLRFDLEHTATAEFAALALSGKFFPKFHLSFHCSPMALRILNAPRETLEASGLELRDGFEKILKDTWKKSEPSLAFPDRTTSAEAPVPTGFNEIITVAGGPALGHGEIGQLGSLNFSILACVDDVDWGKLRRMVHSAVRFLDNLLETATYPAEESAKRSLAKRKIGLGGMGFAELLIKLGLPFDSEAAVLLAEKLQRFIRQEAEQASAQLAAERGPCSKQVQALPGRPALRHASLTATVEAPFAALLADVSPGIQPIESLMDVQIDAQSQSQKLSPLPLLQQVSESRKIWSVALEAEILARGSVRNCEAAPKPLRRLFVTRNEIDLESLLKIQAAFQKHSDGAIALSLALPQDAEWKSFQELLMLCEHHGVWQVGLPGHPQFEDRPEAQEAAPAPEAAAPSEAPMESALDAQTSDEALAEPASEAAEIEITSPGTPAPAYPRLQPRTRPEVLTATSRILQTGYGPMSLLLGRDALGPYELRAQWGKAGSRESAEAEALARLTTLLLGTGVDLKLIHGELRGIRSPRSAFDGGEEVLSGADAIALFLERELKTELLAESDEEITVVTDVESLN